MYLLKPGSVPLWHLIMSYSHSTMHLLKLDERIEELVEKKFTFHHVSIKTHCICCFAHSISDSHSTMYLLNPVASSSISYTS